MKNNHYYNLLSQLVTELRSLWRIKKYYLKESKGCKDCYELYNQLLKVKSEWVEKLDQFLKKHK